MIESLPLGFSSDAFFRQLKQAWTSDPTEAAELLMQQVKSICRSIIRNTRLGFYHVTKEDFEDYTQEAWMKLWMNMEDFLANPKNDPDSEGEHYDPHQKYALARMIVLREMQHLRDRKMEKNPKGWDNRRIQLVSSDQPVCPGDGDAPLSLFIPDRNPTPDRVVAEEDALRDAIAGLFSLPNSPETLAAVGYVILSNALEGKQSMSDLAENLNQLTVLQVVERIESLLDEHGYDPSWMTPFRKRVTKENGNRQITGLTAAKLANRKNDVQGMLRKRAAESEP